MKHAALLALAALPVVLLTGCRSPEPAPPPASIDIAASDAAAGTGTPPSVEAPPGERADAGSHSPAPTAPPPAGMYAIALSDRSSTCPGADAGAPSSAAAPLFITIRPLDGGKYRANLPVNTGVGSLAIDRHDVVLDVGQVETSVLRPDRTCAYEVSRRIEIREVGPTRIVANVRSEYTDAVRCTLPRKPVSCKRDVDVTYTLVDAACPPGCIAEPKPRLRDGGVEATCVCPDGGPL